MDGFWIDIRSALRSAVRTPTLSAVAILTMGLGIGATTFMFAVVYGTLFRGPDVRDAERLVLVYETRPEDGIDRMSFPLHDFLDFREQQTTLESLHASYSGTVNLAGEDGPPERYQGAFITAGGLSTLGVQPILGRTFREGDDLPGAPPLLVVSHPVWTNRFASDPAIIGRAVRVNGERGEIIGVMPEGFHFPMNQDVWLPLRLDPAELGRREGTGLQVHGYLREGVSVESATAELESVARRIEEAFPRANRGILARAMIYNDAYVPSQIRSMMGIMIAMGLGVLIVACANVANLLLARATGRVRDVAVRSALGAQRWRVVRQLLVEAVVLGVAGGVLGLILAHVSLALFTGYLEGMDRPYWIAFFVDLPVLLFISGLTLAAAVAAGTVPALRATGGSLGSILRDESRGSSSLRMGRFSGGLVVVELAVSCGLMIGAGVMAEALVELNGSDPGFDASSLITGRLGLFESDYPDAVARSRFYHDVVQALQAEPEVLSAAVMTALPGTGAPQPFFEIDGATYLDERDRPQAALTRVTAGALETVGVRVMEGRTFRMGESEVEGDAVAVVNRSFADRNLAGGSPLGRRIRVDGDDTWYRVVGVVSDVAPGVVAFGSQAQRVEAVYMPLGEAAPAFASILARTSGPPVRAGPAVRRAVSSLDGQLPVYWLRTMDEALREATFIHRILGLQFMIFGAAALFLAAVGLYGVVDFSVRSRIREMGVRIALGADRGAVVRLIMGRVLRQVGLGALLGLILGAGLALPLSALLFGVDPWTPWVYAAVLGTLLTTAILAALPPTRRAIAVDPTEALAA